MDLIMKEGASLAPKDIPEATAIFRVQVIVSVARLPSLHPTSGVLGHTVLMGLAAPWYAQSAYWSAGRRDGQVAELGG